MSIVSLAFGKYFEKFFVGFDKKRDLDSSLLSGVTELRNIKLNPEALKEYIGNVPLEVVSGFISRMKIQIKLSKITQKPVLIEIDEIELELAEPTELRPPVPPSEDKKKKDEKPKKTGSMKKVYPTPEKVIDGVTLEIKNMTIRIRTLGAKKTFTTGPWTPPCLTIALTNFTIYTVNEKWEVTSLEDARLINDTSPTDIFVFKRGSGKLAVELSPNGEKGELLPVPIIKETDFDIRAAVRKTAVFNQKPNVSEDEQESPILAFECTLNFGALSIPLTTYSINQLAHLAEGLERCVFREDLILVPVQYGQILDGPYIVFGIKAQSLLLSVNHDAPNTRRDILALPSTKRDISPARKSPTPVGKEKNKDKDKNKRKSQEIEAEIAAAAMAATTTTTTMPDPAAPSLVLPTPTTEILPAPGAGAGAAPEKKSDEPDITESPGFLLEFVDTYLNIVSPGPDYMLGIQLSIDALRSRLDYCNHMARGASVPPPHKVRSFLEARPVVPGVGADSDKNSDIIKVSLYNTTIHPNGKQHEPTSATSAIVLKMVLNNPSNSDYRPPSNVLELELDACIAGVTLTATQEAITAAAHMGEDIGRYVRPVAVEGNIFDYPKRPVPQPPPFMAMRQRMNVTLITPTLVVSAADATQIITDPKIALRGKHVLAAQPRLIRFKLFSEGSDKRAANTPPNPPRDLIFDVKVEETHLCLTEDVVPGLPLAHTPGFEAVASIDMQYLPVRIIIIDGFTNQLDLPNSILKYTVQDVKANYSAAIEYRLVSLVSTILTRPGKNKDDTVLNKAVKAARERAPTLKREAAAALKAKGIDIPDMVRSGSGSGSVSQRSASGSTTGTTPVLKPEPVPAAAAAAAGTTPPTAAAGAEDSNPFKRKRAMSKTTREAHSDSTASASGATSSTETAIVPAGEKVVATVPPSAVERLPGTMDIKVIDIRVLVYGKAVQGQPSLRGAWALNQIALDRKPDPPVNGRVVSSDLNLTLMDVRASAFVGPDDDERTCVAPFTMEIKAKERLGVVTAPYTDIQFGLGSVQVDVSAVQTAFGAISAERAEQIALFKQADGTADEPEEDYVKNIMKVASDAVKEEGIMTGSEVIELRHQLEGVDYQLSLADQHARAGLPEESAWARDMTPEARGQLVKHMRDPRSGVPLRAKAKGEAATSFIGSEAVTWLAASYGIENREVAVGVLRQLQAMRVIEHVDKESPFADDYAFFEYVSAQAAPESVGSVVGKWRASVLQDVADAQYALKTTTSTIPTPVAPST